MLMILARLVRSESFWAVVKVRSPHTGPEFGYPRPAALAHPIAPRCFPRHVVAHAAAPSALTAVAGRYPRRRPTHRHRPCRCHTWPTYRRRP